MTERAATDRVASSPSETALPGPATALALLAFLVVFFAISGAYAPTELPDYVASPRQVIGMALMLTLLPPYVIVATWAARRRSLALVEQARPLLRDASAADEARTRIATALRTTWRPFLVAGVVAGLLNNQPLALLRSEIPVLEGAVTAGQLLMWSLIGIMAGVRFRSAQAFRRLAEVVPVDLLRPDRLRPIARSGLVDVVVIMGAMLMAPLQSLDAEFRWYNYRFALIVAVPFTVFSLVWPIAPLHRRNREARDARLAEVDRQLVGLAGPDAPRDAEASARLETLLAHRDRLQAARTWPLSLGVLSRVVLYLVIPPLAWAGAAVVERLVDRLLGG